MARPGRPHTPQAPYLFFLIVFPRPCHPRRREGVLSLEAASSAPRFLAADPRGVGGPVLVVLAPAAQKGRSRAPLSALAVLRRLPSLAAMDAAASVQGSGHQGGDETWPGLRELRLQPAVRPAPPSCPPRRQSPCPAPSGLLHVGTGAAGQVATLTGHSGGRIPRVHSPPG